MNIGSNARSHLPTPSFRGGRWFEPSEDSYDNLFEPRGPKRPRGSIAISVGGESRRDAQHAFEPGGHPPVPAAEERDQGGDEE
jgi:hypothetical protein